MKWKMSDFVDISGYLGPHCIVPSLYVDVLKMKVVNAAQIIPQLHAAPIIINILHFVICVSGRVMDRYLCILIYINVCIDVIRHVAFKKLLIKHTISPKIHFCVITVVKENGASNIPTKKSAIAKFTKNILVLVRIPRWRITTAMTIKFPKIAKTIEIVSHVPKNALSNILNSFLDELLLVSLESSTS